MTSWNAFHPFSIIDSSKDPIKDSAIVFMRNLPFMHFGSTVAPTVGLRMSLANKLRLFFLLATISIKISGTLATDSPLPNNSQLNEPVKSADQFSSVVIPTMRWVLLAEGSSGTCTSNTECCENIICYGLEYTPGLTGEMTSYTTGFIVDCLNNSSPVLSNSSCVIEDNSLQFNWCVQYGVIQFHSQGNNGTLDVTSGVPVIIHQVCFSVPLSTNIDVMEDGITDLTVSIDLETEYPEYENLFISRMPPVLPAHGASTVQCLSQTFIPDPPSSITDQCGNPLSGALQPVLDSPQSITCEGTRTYTYTFTDCEGQTSNWNYVFTIERQNFSNPPDNGITITDPEDANVEPTAYLPTVVDNCGNTLTPSVPAVSAPIICQGQRTYTYTFTDCEGNIQDWVFTYSTPHSTLVENNNDSDCGSLRSIINSAYAGDTIIFSPGLMNQTITLTSGEIEINKHLNIHGPGMLNLVISGNNSSRIFHLFAGKNLNIKDLSLKDGNLIANGGAILTEGNLTIKNILFQNNFQNGSPKSISVTNNAFVNIGGIVEMKN